MAKRVKVEVEGFLHGVSEMCQSGERYRYFTALLQEAQRNCRVVVFDTQKHATFKSAEKDRTPVKLCDVAFSPSRQKKGEMDILVNSASSVRCVRQLEFIFDESLREVVQDVTLEDIVKDPREYQRVNVTVKVVQLTEDRETFTRSHQKMRKRAYDVADQTHGMSLCVWGGELLTSGNWYKVTNASVRQFSGETCMSTTAQSKWTQVEDINVVIPAMVDHTKVVEGQLVTADVTVDYKCPKQHVVPNVNLSTAVTRCQQCAAFFRTAAASAVLRAKVTVEDATGHMTDFVVDDFVLRQLLHVGSEKFFETDVLVSKLLGAEGIQFKCRGNRVMAASFLPAGTESPQQMDQTKGPVPTASCSNANEAMEDSLMLEDFFRCEAEEDLTSQTKVHEKDTEKVEAAGVGHMAACFKGEESAAGSPKEEPEGSVRPKLAKCERNAKASGKKK